MYPKQSSIAKMPILDASSLIVVSANQHKKITSWTVATTLLELLMQFNPVKTLSTLMEQGNTGEFCFFSYRDTTADADDFDKMVKCENTLLHGRHVFMTSLFSPYGELMATHEHLKIAYTPLGDLLHQNSHRSCALKLLQEMLGPHFKITSRSLYEITKTADGNDLGCHTCPAKWHRVGLFIEFVHQARPRDEYIHSLWPELDTFTFNPSSYSPLKIGKPITTKEEEWNLHN